MMEIGYMSIKNRVIAFLYRLGASCISIGALIYDFGFLKGEFKRINFLYFTIISNMFCCGLFITLTIKTLIDIKREGIHGTSSISPHIKGEVLISILLTMIVYHFILIPYALKINTYQSLKTTDIIFHYVMPLVTLFDWILFDEKRRFSWYDPIVWTIGPYLYMIFVFFQSRIEIVDRVNNHINRYVYAFLDVGLLGNIRVFFNIISLSVFFVGLGFCLFGLDRIKIYEENFKN